MLPFRTRVALPALLIALAIAAPVPAQTVTNDDTVLKQIIIFGRHSVRASAVPPAVYATLSTRPLPDFEVPTGYLTVQGQKAEVLLGAYFRDYLLAEGILTGDAATDLGRTFFRANSIQRSNVTAAMFGNGLIPGVTIQVHSYPLGQTDPVFDPISTGVAAIDANRAADEVRRIYNNGTALASAYSAEFSLIRSVVFDYQNGVQPPPAAPSGVTDITAQPIPLEPVTTGVQTGNVVILGAITSADLAADPFIMEYADGMPLASVGWGQFSMDTLSQQSRMTTLSQRIAFRTPYLAQVQSSNAAAHILRSMRQAVLGAAVPGAFSGPASKVVVVISSDDYVTGVAALLQAHWQLPGYQPDFCAPGGALVFELRQSMATGEYLVRLFYTAQSLDQLRNLTPLNLAAPPETIQLLIPGGSKPGASLDVPFKSFQQLLHKAIGWEYVQNPSDEVPPGVLTGVPLQ